jgi:hypothetical protein
MITSPEKFGCGVFFADFVGKKHPTARERERCAAGACLWHNVTTPSRYLIPMFGWIVSFHHRDTETLREQGFPFSLPESWRSWRLGVLAVSLTIQTYLV